MLKITKIAVYPQKFARSLRNLVRWCKMALLTAPTVKKFEFHKSKMADGRHFENHIFAAVRPILMKFGTMTHIGPLQRKDR